MSHTKEPWSLTHNNWATTTIYDAGARVICEVEIDSDVTEETEDEFEAIKEANARRIVACVNACAGIDTETLESGNFPMQLAGILALKLQRDELLAALVKAADFIQPYNSARNLLEELDAAIASVKGEKK